LTSNNFLFLQKVIQKSDDSYLIENQILVANNFLPVTVISEEISVLLYGNFIEKSKSSFEFEFSLQTQPDVRDEPFYYHAELIEVFSETLKGTEASNINLTKVQEVLRLKYLVSFLLEADDLFKKPSKAFFKQSVLRNELSPFYEDFDNIVENNSELILEKNEIAIGLLKPRVLEIINLIYFSPPKISIERIYKSSYHFIKYFQEEEKRLGEYQNFDDMPQREQSYIFDNFLNFLKIYHKKLISNDGNPELIEREDKVAINGICQQIQKNLNSFRGKLTNQQNKNLKSFLGVLKEGDGKEKIKNDGDLELERPMMKNSKKLEENSQIIVWDVFLKNFLSSSIVEKVSFCSFPKKLIFL